MDKELELLNEILSIPSVNGKDDERKIAEFICKYLQDNHVKAKVQYIDDRHANVLAVIPGKSGKNIIWNGHLDTVPYGNLEEWETDPAAAVLKDGRLFARGASDMKSGLL